MIKQYKNYTIILLIAAFVLIFIVRGIDKPDNEQTEPADTFMLFNLAGIILICLGCMYMAKGKGYHGAWGFLGLLNFIGVLILLFFKDKTKQPKEVKPIHIEPQKQVVQQPIGKKKDKEKSDKDKELAYLREIDRLRENKRKGAKITILVDAPPLRGLGSKMLQVVAVGALTGSPNVGAMSVQYSKEDTQGGILFPKTCCLCNIYYYTRNWTLYQDVVSSWAGMFLGGPILGMSKVEIPVPICYHCEKHQDLAPGVEVVKFKKENKVWKLTLRFLNENVAEKFEQMNQSVGNNPIKVS